MKVCLKILGISLISSVLSIAKSSAQSESEVQDSLYVFMSEDCPISQYMLKALAQIDDEYYQRLEVIAVFPIRSSSKSSAQEFLASEGLSFFKIILDHNQEYSRRYEARVVPECKFVSRDGLVRYSGRITDAYSDLGRKKHRSETHDLQKYLEAFYKHGQKEIEKTEAIGCKITFFPSH